MASEPVETKQTASDFDALSTPTPELGKTRQSRVRQKESLIIAAARDMFIESGYAKTTMAVIARKAGVADGTLYTYFENKDALARAVISDFYRRLTQGAQTGVDQRSTTREKLEFLARHHIERLMEERGIIEMLPLLTSSLADYSGSLIYEMNKHYVGVFDTVIREGRAVGDIPADAKVWVLRDIFFGALDYGAKTMLIRFNTSDVTRFVEQLVGMVVGSGAAGLSLADKMESIATRMDAALKQIGQ